jgi:transposase InsO family protein
MSDWLTLSDLADLALPGFPATRKGWALIAEQEGWNRAPGKARPSAGRGGGLEYHIDLLHGAALAALAAKTIGVVALSPADGAAAAAGEAAQKAAAGGPSPAAQLSLNAIEGRDARLAVLAAAEKFRAGGRLSGQTADALFCSLYNEGRIDAEPWVRASVRKLSAVTLARWRRLKREGAGRLAVDRGVARRGKGKLEAARAFILALIVERPHITADHLREIVAARFPALENVSHRTFQTFRSRIEREDKVLIARVANPDAFKSKYRLTGGSPHQVERVNELWMIDASPADMLCVDGRHSVYLCIDIFSRRLVVYVSKTPRAEAVTLLMRRALIAWGVPERVKTDNGSDFIAKWTKSLFLGLGIEVELSDAFAPWQKGHIERAVRTFQHDLAPLLPGYVGHSVADRRVIEERKAFSARLGASDAEAFQVELTAKELQAYCDDWAANRYAHRAHSGIGGATPFAMAQSGAVRRIDNVRALDVLLAPIAGSDGMRTVTKRGVKINYSHYLAPAVLPGARVFVRMDPEDMGRAWLFSPDGQNYLGEAICPELAGIDPAAAVAEARARQKKLLEEGVAELRAGMRAIKPRDMVDTVLRRGAEKAGKLVEFPRAATPYTTPGLDAAAEAAGAMDEAAAEAVADAPSTSFSPSINRSENGSAPAAPVVHLPETPQQRFRRARDLEARLAAGERLETEEALWLGSYRAGVEYQSMQTIFEDFGEQALK